VSPQTLSLLLGFGIGAIIGATALLMNFCALGAVADILFARDWRRMRAWMLAAGTAMIGSQGLAAAGLISFEGSPYFASPSPWLGLLLGSVTFGYGMSLSGGCINRALVRLGAGSLKSLVIVLTVAVTAATAAGGLLVPVIAAIGSVGTPGPNTLGQGINSLFGLPQAVGQWTVTALLGGGLIAFAIKDRWFRADPLQLFGSIALGAMIPLAWLVTARLTQTTTAINFAAPVGDTLSALIGDLPITFAVAVVVGVPVGSFLAAAGTRNLSLETFTDREDLPRNLAGGALMGMGGTLGLGCTFGQGLSGLSTLAPGSVLAVAGMIFGCLWGIRAFEAGSTWGGLKLTVAVLARRA
jgi:uncharacterized membrane protein YedE/YeeE